ncbi:MAG: cobD [Gemmatimonadetes bacterium]|nr:cobD [Gemmatimonadota bacterium]
MVGPAVAALFADVVLGEPPTELHPTVWMGRWLAHGRSMRHSRRAPTSFLEGAGLLLRGVAITAIAAGALDRVLDCSDTPFNGVLRGVALKPALSLRPLLAAAADVQEALERRRLGEARRLLAWHLVSRDTRTLSASEVAGAVIESVAENLNDSVVAPLLAFRVGGLAAAYAYRMINTADAMLGYRTAELEWFGKAAARMDDVVGLVPARCTALLIAAAAPGGAASLRRAVSCALADARRTESPNAGWPMAAMAGALGVRLTKRGQYALNLAGREPRPNDIARACRIVGGAALLAAISVDLT